jgi:site-specific recombinase XerD
MKSVQNLSLLFWLWKAKTDKRGKAPIYIRITIDGVQAQISSGLKVEPEFYNPQKEQVKSKTLEAQMINSKIQTIRGQLQHQFVLLCAQSENVHPEMLKEIFLGKMQPKKSFMDIFDYHNTVFSQKVEAGKRGIATLKKYYATKEKLRAFLKAQYGREDMSLTDVKQTFTNDFEHYLSVYEHLQNNTIMKHIKNLKKILTLAVQKDLLTTNPFQFYRCTYESTDRERLTEDELKILMKAKFIRVALEEARDCYIAMCFTGYAYKDAFLLGPENIRIMEDGGRWFVKNREKTSSNENVPILPIVEQIIEKYQKHPYCLAYNKVFPIHSNQKFNSYLKDITKASGINKELTTHTARHTFATTVTLTNGMPIETVSKLLGHRSIKTTQIYAKVVEKKVSEDMKTLNKKWSDKLN